MIDLSGGSRTEKSWSLDLFVPKEQCSSRMSRSPHKYTFYCEFLFDENVSECDPYITALHFARAFQWCIPCIAQSLISAANRSESTEILVRFQCNFSNDSFYIYCRVTYLSITAYSLRDLHKVVLKSTWSLYTLSACRSSAWCLPSFVLFFELTPSQRIDQFISLNIIQGGWTIGKCWWILCVWPAIGSALESTWNHRTMRHQRSM